MRIIRPSTFFFYFLILLVSSCKLPWQKAKEEFKELPEVAEYSSEAEPQKAQEFFEFVDDGDLAAAVNRTVDPPGVSEGIACPDIPIPEFRPVEPESAIVLPAERPEETVEKGISQVALGTGVCRYYDKWVAEGVPKEPLKQMLKYFDKNKSNFRNQRYLSFADYSQRSSEKRFYLFDMQTGKVTKEPVSHGSGYKARVNYGDKNHDGRMDRCSHNNGSRTNMTRVGFFKTANFYFSAKHDRKKKARLKSWPDLAQDKTNSRVNGLRMIGLSETNKEALNSGVVMHEAYYNEDAMNGMGIMGRSYGCPAFLPGRGASIMNKISEGSLYYSYNSEQCEDEMRRGPLSQVSGWQSMCESR